MSGVKIGSKDPKGARIGSTLVKAKYIGSEKVWKDAMIYGFHVDPTKSDPAQAVTYLADAVGKTPAAMGASTFSYGDWEDAFFMPKPCMLKYDGTVDYYLDPDDYTKKANGTASNVASSSYGGNAMMEWPLIWYKFKAGEADGEGYFYCSDKQIDSSYQCFCNINADGDVIPHFYTPIYNITRMSGKARSLSGFALTSANGSGYTTGADELTAATANNTTAKTEWYTGVWCDRVLISALLVLIGKSLDCQAVFGRGLDTGGYNAKTAYVTGSLNNKGLFWGNTSAGTSGVKVFGMENFYGCCWHRIAGLIGTASGYLVKMTAPYSSAGTGYEAVSGRPSAYGVITKMSFGSHGMLPKETSRIDNSLYWAETLSPGSEYSLVGGMSGDEFAVGTLRMGFGVSYGTSDWSVTGSLSCKPRRHSRSDQG